MARPYKKRAKKSSDFKICDLNKLKEQCLCSADNVCVCASLKGICSGVSSSEAKKILSQSPNDSPVDKVESTNGFAALES